MGTCPFQMFSMIPDFLCVEGQVSCIAYQVVKAPLM